MGAAEDRAKHSKMAADLIKAGYPHGKRRSKPYPNSGGTTMVNAPGSSKYQRLMARLRKTVGKAA
jgi:hypothetical protein